MSPRVVAHSISDANIQKIRRRTCRLFEILASAGSLRSLEVAPTGETPTSPGRILAVVVVVVVSIETLEGLPNTPLQADQRPPAPDSTPIGLLSFGLDDQT